jgi:hypothetical protein
MKSQRATFLIFHGSPQYLSQYWTAENAEIAEKDTEKRQLNALRILRGLRELCG